MQTETQAHFTGRGPGGRRGRPAESCFFGSPDSFVRPHSLLGGNAKGKFDLGNTNEDWESRNVQFCYKSWFLWYMPSSPAFSAAFSALRAFTYLIWFSEMPGLVAVSVITTRITTVETRATAWVGTPSKLPPSTKKPANTQIAMETVPIRQDMNNIQASHATHSAHQNSPGRPQPDGHPHPGVHRHAHRHRLHCDAPVQEHAQRLRLPGL